MGTYTRFPSSLSSFPVFFCALFLYLPPCSFPLFALPPLQPSALYSSRRVVTISSRPANWLLALLIISTIFISASVWTRLSYTFKSFWFSKDSAILNDKMAFAKRETIAMRFLILFFSNAYHSLRLIFSVTGDDIANCDMVVLTHSTKIHGQCL